MRLPGRREGRTWRGLGFLTLGWLPAAHGALDELTLIQKGTQLQPDAEASQFVVRPSMIKDVENAEHGAPATMLVGQRRKNALAMMREGIDKYMVSEESMIKELDAPDSLKTLDPAMMMEMLPSLMDALRDDNFIRSFIEFEDGVEQASSRVIRSAHDHLEKFLKAANSSVALARDGNTAALRVGFAQFLDHWIHKVLTSYTKELADHATLFSQQVGGEHQLSKSFADLFVPLFTNVTQKLSTRMISGAPGNASHPMTFEEVLATDTEAHFCELVEGIIHNATKSEKEALKVLKVINGTRRSMVPMLGKFMSDTLPLDASEEDKEVPKRMMLVFDYEVSIIYDGLNTLRETMGEYGHGLAPIFQQGMHCHPDAAVRLCGIPHLGALLAAALALYLRL